MKISIDEARKQKVLLEQHLCDQIRAFEECTGSRVRSLELLRSHSLVDRIKFEELDALVAVVTEVLL